MSACVGSLMGDIFIIDCGASLPENQIHWDAVMVQGRWGWADLRYRSDG